MGPEQQLQITLPKTLVQAVRDRVAAGEYRDESEMISEGLQTLLSPGVKDEGFEQWLLAEAVPAYDALRARPETARSVAEVRARLHAEHKEQLGS